MEEISFNIHKYQNTLIKIDAHYVNDKLSYLKKNDDLERFIL